MGGSFGNEDISEEFRCLDSEDSQCIKEYRKRVLKGEIESTLKIPALEILLDQMKPIPNQWK